MSVYDAVQRATDLLPGEPAPDGELDPRWQAIIALGEYVETEPEAVWEFTHTWGRHPQEDLRAAIATCLLEHLLQLHFAVYFPKVERLAGADRLFAGTFLTCSKFGQAKEPGNAARFDRLMNRLLKRRTDRVTARRRVRRPRRRRP